MPIDIDKLMAFRIPEMRQMLRPDDLAFYALSIGMGRDPLDTRQLAYVDPLQGPVVMPAMVLVMAHPGFWLGDPQSGVDPTAVLHAAQGFEILGPIPAQGAVGSRTRVVEVLDKGPGKAGLILSQTELSDDTGRIFARLDRTTFIRDGGGFGGSAESGGPAATASPPDGPPDLTVDLATGAEQALLYRLNGDLNPLHSDPALARKLGFERPILHGLCTMGVVAHALLRGLCDYRAGDLRGMQLRFSRPVYPGETIRTEIWTDGSFRALVPERGAVVIEGGMATVGLPCQA
ncbi:MaoC/PaaZ C-terminal domain-containing protein [Ruixingdingia sedimenti]|uniref:MaoC/PaaZ C-terminal domain-containing protein n=1 Tax=Ruixingdingia sedimenti TaxID=3073604 RepID=A0ABU1F8Y4_9RHOB|nr:MaoC/PaaZ C-terminal domain-containing protein [Xinfangfangia sp. LG-4]MDR5653294.1 MaoC/PaaZ C-terminal domain-containing protein [Xinfangfangia sp. LG-4]